MICDESLAERAQRLKHYRHSQWPPISAQVFTLGEHIASFSQLVAVAPVNAKVQEHLRMFARTFIGYESFMELSQIL